MSSDQTGSEMYNDASPKRLYTSVPFTTVTTATMPSTTNPSSPLLSSTTKNPISQDGSQQTTNTNSQSAKAATSTAAPALQTNLTPSTPIPRKADTYMTWGAPAGLSIRNSNDENLVIFRRALGINASHQTSTNHRTVEEGRRSAIGIYRSVIHSQSTLRLNYALLQAFLYIVYFLQIIIGAVLTALGATASRYEKVITVLGALNTVLAGVLALIKGSGQPMKMGKDRIGYRRLQDWIEETEALLAVGVIGRDRREVGLLVESAFKRYNAVKESVENNDPDYYVFAGRKGSEDHGERTGADGK
ncbi:hypothetical protein F5Y18DRAFT_439617 [Xylariaceae sp. FL1019]|nr:hypothetical protein F5Y18DRAFT_439617 [Xylariaceae sp. FL1019]